MHLSKITILIYLLKKNATEYLCIHFGGLGLNEPDSVHRSSLFPSIWKPD